MSKAIYWQRGESLDYVNTGVTVIEANSIIDLNKHRIAVAGTSINPNEKGSIHVTVFIRFRRPTVERFSLEQMYILMVLVSLQQQDPIHRQDMQQKLPLQEKARFSLNCLVRRN